VFFEDVVHTGVDIPAPTGTPVLAAAAGKVTWAGYGLYSGYHDVTDPYGMAVLIRHDFGYQGARLYTVYAHLSQVDVLKGQRVEAGSIIGLSGETGKATGPHLHFEVRQERDGFFSTYNPELWLVPPQGWGVIAGRVMNSGGLKIKGQLVQVRSMASDQIWKAITYGGGNTHEDPAYRENMAISDLPAGWYEIKIYYLGKNYSLEVEIHPGLVTYFTFRGRSGFTAEQLKVPGADFNPLYSP
jgi:murein DD-endopeptidase MepM/ murein hydrolase activator NlpD